MRTFWLVIIIIIIAAVGVYFWKWYGGVSGPGVSYNEAPAQPPTAVAPATAAESTPDAIASVLLSNSRESVVTPVETDPTLVAPNDEAVNSFDQSFDASQF